MDKFLDVLAILIMLPVCLAVGVFLVVLSPLWVPVLIIDWAYQRAVKS